eukprot:TRINITY_DN1248_c0_g1_i1.p1 TRINITY_DN1248_c0_g1~~TRINITY_DN1248_c0_g1_i1.p1  ORF type:complete len:737 (+),score=104.84 TRINITY_DN1248_c0_g1_i1:919-3129(+)
MLNELVMQRFDQIDPGTEVPDEVQYSAPVSFEVAGPPSTMTATPEKDCKLSVSYLLGRSDDVVTTTSLSLLSSLLMSGPNSPMYQALIESNLGNNWSPGSGYESSLRETSFSIGLQGIAQEDAPRVERLVLDTLKASAESGFPQERIDSLLHQIDLSMRHVTTEFGIEVAAGVSHSWIHGGSPLRSLDTLEAITVIRKRLAEGPYFQDLIKTHFLNNTHRVTVLMTPDETYNEQKQRREKEKVAAIAASLSAAEKEQIVANSAALSARQDEVQDVSILPFLNLDDIPLETRKDHFFSGLIDATSVQWNPQPTNGITYARFMFDTAPLPPHLLPYVPLFTALLPSMGAREHDYRALAQLIEAKTGGVGASAKIERHHTDLSSYSTHVVVGVHALDSNLEEALDIVSSLCVAPSFTNLEHIKTLLDATESGFQSGLIDNGHQYARSYAASSLSPAQALSEQWHGISQFKFLQQLVAAEDIAGLAQRLTEVASLLFSRQHLRICINAEATEFERIEAVLESFVAKLPASHATSPFVAAATPTNSPTLFPPPSTPNSYIGVPVDTHHSAMVLNSAAYTDPHYPPAVVLGNILRNAYLHREIREKGGAYGGGAGGAPGSFSFYSYRDPNTLPTLAHFRESLQWGAEGQFTDENILEAKLNQFALLDAPVAPQHVGVGHWTTGLTHEHRQTNRDRLRALGRSDIQELASNLLANTSTASSVIFGDSAEKATFAAMDNWSYSE